jgi:CBS domain containing-hemolysin-like protein
MTALLLIALLLLVAINGFFVAAEFALVRSRQSKLEAMLEEGKGAGTRLALEQIEQIDEYLSACQLGITMASIGIGFLGEAALASRLEEPLGDVASHGVATGVAVGLAYFLVTSLHITAGEQAPKIYAIVHAEGVARRVARPLQWFRAIFKPFIALLNAVSNGLLRLVGVKAAELDESATSDDLKMLIARSVSGGELDPGEAGMLSGVFHLHEQEARQVMTPIPAVVTVDVSDNVKTALQHCVDSGHTRLVVTEDHDEDRVRGIVHLGSLSRRFLNEGPDASFEDAIKDVPVVPETKPLDDLLAELQRDRVGLAIVADEYGRTAGIVTVEDIIEEVVGEIADETDPALAPIRRLGNGDWFVRGHMPITDLADYDVDLEVDSDAFNSVGGFVFNELGRLPKRGDMVHENGYSIRVESVRENRVEAVRIRDHEPHRRNGRKRQQESSEEG